MKPVLNVNQVRSLDTFAINELGMPEAVLMENAANYTYNFIKSKSNIFHTRPKVLILCGVGNNGGDGLALARLMINEYDVETILVGNLEKMSNVTKNNFQILKNIYGNIEYFNENNDYNFDKYDIIVDALIGVGFNGELRQNIKKLLRGSNNSKSIKIAIDVPSGLNADNGEHSEDAFLADYTITMFADKLGFYLCDKNITGEVVVADLGLPKNYAFQFANNYIIDDAEIEKYGNSRDITTSKFDYGKVGIIAGSHKYSGAAALTANACIKSGAGLVYLFSPIAHSSLFPEIIFEKLSEIDGFIDSSNYDTLFKRLETMDSIVIGPGIGQNQFTLELIGKIVQNLSKEIPILIDADALQITKKHNILRENIIITPHIGEFADISFKNRNEISRYNDCIELSKKLNCTVLLKGHHTLISNGNITFINTNGNPGMATAGSGDVLSGIIGSLLARGIDVIKAGAIGAYLHARAGDIYALKYNQMSLTASDIINEIKNIVVDSKS